MVFCVIVEVRQQVLDPGMCSNRQAGVVQGIQKVVGDDKQGDNPIGPQHREHKEEQPVGLSQPGSSRPAKDPQNQELRECRHSLSRSHLPLQTKQESTGVACYIRRQEDGEHRARELVKQHAHDPIHGSNPRPFPDRDLLTDAARGRDECCAKWSRKRV